VTRARYRNLDGEEIELPLAMERWVLVPRGLARFDPELIWTLDYDDAPAPELADPRLDFSAGALLVPVERWNEHAALEPNLAPCRIDAPLVATIEAPPPASASALEEWLVDEREPRRLAVALAAALARIVSVALAALAVGYLGAVAGWLVSLRDRISGPDVSTGVLLVGAAVLLAWLIGFAGASPDAPALPSRYRCDCDRPARAVLQQLAEHPLLILRVGLAVQIAGFLAFAALH
jgi:hypothetical protein